MNVGEERAIAFIRISLGVGVVLHVKLLLGMPTSLTGVVA